MAKKEERKIPKPIQNKIINKCRAGVILDSNEIQIAEKMIKKANSDSEMYKIKAKKVKEPELQWYNDSLSIGMSMVADKLEKCVLKSKTIKHNPNYRESE